MPENKLLRCSKRKCGSHVFTIYKDATDQHILICDLCHTPQYLNQLKTGTVPVSNMMKLSGNSKFVVEKNTEISTAEIYKDWCEQVMDAYNEHGSEIRRRVPESCESVCVDIIRVLIKEKKVLSLPKYLKFQYK